MKKEEDMKLPNLDEVIIITENALNAFVIGDPICVGGVWFIIPENSEMRIINAVEQKLVKEYGLDGEWEEEI